MIDIRSRRNGRLKIKIMGAVNLPGKRSSKDDYFAVLRIDGITKATTKSTRSKIDETFDIQVEKANEVEIAVYDKPSGGQNKPSLLAFVWFTLAELEEELNATLGPHYAQKPLNAPDMNDVWLDMEPGGQIAMRVNFGKFG
jgi:hypothetical protein